MMQTTIAIARKTLPISCCAQQVIIRMNPASPPLAW
jgi:hypothetical protein